MTTNFTNDNFGEQREDYLTVKRECFGKIKNTE